MTRQEALERRDWVIYNLGGERDKEAAKLAFAALKGEWTPVTEALPPRSSVCWGTSRRRPRSRPCMSAMLTKTPTGTARWCTGCVRSRIRCGCPKGRRIHDRIWSGSGLHRSEVLR